MIEFFKTQMGHAFFEGTVPRIARALERIATALEKEPPRPPAAWESDNIQFPRMLAEIRAIGFSSGMYEELCASMDLSIDEIDEILERAESAWNKIKEPRK